MKNRNLLLLVSLLMIFFMPGCDVIIGVFKAGFWTAIILVLLIGGIGLYLYRKFSSSR